MKCGEKSKNHIFHFHFINRPLLFITTNQRFPIVSDPAAQKFYWRSTRPFFPIPMQKDKSSLTTGATRGTEGLHHVELLCRATPIAFQVRKRHPKTVREVLFTWNTYLTEL